MDARYATYFQDYEPKPVFAKAFVSIFNGWLGTENLHLLDEVTDAEYEKFNLFLRLLHEKNELLLVDRRRRRCRKVKSIAPLLASHSASLEKSSAEFTTLVIPELEAIIEESWDYTAILWHRENGAREALTPLIAEAGLYCWQDDEVSGAAS